MMDRTDAFRRLSDVVNLQDRVTTAERVVDAADTKIDKARERLADSEASKAKAEDQLEAVRYRLDEARELASEIPPDLIPGLAEEIGAKRAARDRVIAAMAAGEDSAEARAAVIAAAEQAGIVLAKAGTATANGEGNGI